MADGKYIAYYRVSSQKQGKSGLGLEAQREAVAGYLNGGAWSLLEEHVEVETGTKKGNNRTELAKALDRCKKENATLLIAKLDRLARNVAFVSALMESGVEFVAVDFPTANRLTIHILAAVAEHEAVAISTRTREALAAAKARGVQLGTPGNLTQEGAKLGACNGAISKKKSAAADYSKLVGLVLNLRHKGMSFQAIATHLNELGETTREGKAFQAMTVKRICDRSNIRI